MAKRSSRRIAPVVKAAEAKAAEVKAAEVKAEVKAEPDKKEVKTEVKPEETAKEVVKEAAEVVKETAKEVAKEAAAVKETAQKAVKKAAATTKKAAAKKTAEKAVLQPEVFLQFDDNGSHEASISEIVEKVKALYVAEGHRESSIKSLRVYMKPQEWKAYYVINNKIAGELPIF